MARIRTIKPKFWTNEDLSALPEATHMLAAALLNYADDEGYFNANPGLIKAECSPLREPSVSIQDSLKMLEGIGYLRLGKASDGKRYGHILTFAEHQVVNRPTPSTIKNLPIEWNAHGIISDRSLPEKEGKGREGNLGGSPDGDPPEQGDEPSNTAPAIPFALVVDAFNRTLDRLPKVRDITTKRRTLIRSAWMASPQRRSVEFWRAYFEECADDAFLNGTGPYRNGHENWRPDFDYLLKTDVVTRVFERAMDRMDRAGVVS